MLELCRWRRQRQGGLSLVSEELCWRARREETVVAEKTGEFVWRTIA